MVRRWRPSALASGVAGPLWVRTAGSGDRVIVLLHGLVATGDVFGADFDVLARSNTLVVPDLLGFGRSLDGSREQFLPDDHLDALDQMLGTLDLDDRPLTIGGHSMGASVAVRWAARRGADVGRVVGWGAPTYPDTEAVDRAVADTGMMSRLFVANTAWASAACHLQCRHRELAGWIAAGLAPSMPVPIARAASLHTWPAYRDAMVHLVAGTDWRDLTDHLGTNGTQLDLVWGSDDRIGSREFARELTNTRIHSVSGAAHHLPMTHGRSCAAQLSGSDGWPDGEHPSVRRR